MVTLEWLYFPIGLMFGAYAVSHARDRSNPARWRSAAFWGLYAVSFLFGSLLPDIGNGVLLLALVVLAAAGLKPGSAPTTSEAERETGARALGNRLFWPALVVPAVTLAGSLLMPDGRIGTAQIIRAKDVTLCFLALGALAGLALALYQSRAPARAVVSEGRRLADSVGWALILPQMLAALGAIFALAQVGDVISKDIISQFSIDQSWMAAALYCIGMAVFTIVMGNAFTAFPVMTAAVGLPLIVQGFGGDPHVMCAIGMLSGFCGTLMTPMAANFNIVPAALLQLTDRNAIIKIQTPTALLVLVGNIIVLSHFGFPQ